MNPLPRNGDRIQLVAMRDDPDPISVGQVGTVVGVRRHGGGDDEWLQIDVAWDNGRTLMLSVPPDQYRTIDD